MELKEFGGCDVHVQNFTLYRSATDHSVNYLSRLMLSIDDFEVPLATQGTSSNQR